MLFYDTIQKQAYSNPTQEVCGYIGTLLDNSGHLIAMPCENSHEVPAEHFRIDISEVRRVEQAINPIAIYHSHINGILAPSEHDRKVADELGLPSFIFSNDHQNSVCYVPPTYLPPLEGRKFVPLIHDCITFVRDYYRAVLNIILSEPERTYRTWDFFAEKIPQWITDHEFEVFTEPEPHDILVLSINNEGIPNHAGIYEGDGIMSHQRADSPSNKTVYGGSWVKATSFALRHKSRVNPIKKW